ncbi:MAG: long-chain fatty acid--CoA ligase [Candidatus Solincola sediminis]|uniref:Long-chain fatty acid--CoA ligase n=1 Tax=Candidatus Solincola sediminis TaxID=1797199 RepID=A0A1F2WM94_9ACTN|nr:MAG: long-chain fatty acid--CoA ligase [Candidatus Solincola sediminis]OFW61414.1 MAG: long-chain fatty acid--CoA ligase [Candidatus Solincola sediminis]
MDRIWYKSYDYFVPESIRYPRIPLYQNLELSCIKYEDNVATIFFDQRLTYGQVRDQVRRLATALRGMGVQKGDRVALMLPNCPQMVIAYYGVLEAGAVVTNISPLHVEREIEYELNDSGSETIIYLDLFDSRIQAVKDITPLKRIIATSITDYMETPVDPNVAKDANTYYFLELINDASPDVPDFDMDPENDLAALQYTGGTTGLPKGVMLTHRNLLANTMQCAMWGREFLERGKDVFLCVIPFFHSYGQTVGMNNAIFNAGTMVLIPQFEINMLLQAIQKYEPNLFPGVPTIYIAILNHPDALAYGVNKIKLCNSGSAPLPIEVHRKFSQISGGIFIEGYGLSESSPVTHSNPLLGMKKIGSVGIPFPDTDCKIVDIDTGLTELGINEPGEIIIKGPQVMKGYWEKPEETAETLRDGWLFTGDVGTMDEDGYFYIVDRKKDMIIAGGFNIYPREIDEVLYEHPKVQEAVAVGIPDEYRGETVKAYVVLKPEEECSEEEIIAFCKERLASFKAPRVVEFRAELPKTLVGKVLRRALREEEMAKQKEQEKPEE